MSVMRWIFFTIAFLAKNGSANQPGVDLKCLKDNIYVKISKGFLAKQNIEVTDAKDLHLSGFSECYSSSEGSEAFSITLFPPYNDCGTRVKVDADKYSYLNEVVFKTGTTTVKVLTFRCEYDKKYVVSSAVALNPEMRTLNFVTKRGEFSVGMSLYQRSDFNPKSMFGLSPTILVGTTVYVSVDTLDTFDMKEIVTTIGTCYATNDYNHATQNLYHSLIVNRCASLDDATVQIISNGESMKGKFSFQMFKWKSDVEYFYLHCEVKVCNKTEEICTGTGPVCTGTPNIEGSPPSNSRRKREVIVSSSGESVMGNQGMVTIGPIKLVEGEQEIGKGSYETDYEKIEKDQNFLRIYIYTAVAGLVLIVGIIVIIIVVVRKARVGKRRKLQNLNGSI